MWCINYSGILRSQTDHLITAIRQGLKLITKKKELVINWILPFLKTTVKLRVDRHLEFAREQKKTVEHKGDCGTSCSLCTWNSSKTWKKDWRNWKYFGYEQYNSAALAVFAKILKMTKYTRLWDAKIAWYSPSATILICLSGSEHIPRIYVANSAWTVEYTDWISAEG